jgi:hypothetical protein
MGAVPGRQFLQPGAYYCSRFSDPPAESVDPVDPTDPANSAPPTDSADSTVAGDGTGHGFSFGDSHTMNLPRAPRLPQNPFAGAACGVICKASFCSTHHKVFNRLIRCPQLPDVPSSACLGHCLHP